MTYDEFLNRAAGRASTSKALVREVLDAFGIELAEELRDGEKVRIAGLGTFSVKERKERKGRNPHTGEEITISARKVAFFKPSKELKEKVDA